MQPNDEAKTCVSMQILKCLLLAEQKRDKNLVGRKIRGANQGKDAPVLSAVARLDKVARLHDMAMPWKVVFNSSKDHIHG